MNRDLFHRFLLSALCVLVVVRAPGQSSPENRPELVSRLERQHLQAVHEARIALQNARKPSGPSHGVYSDFKAVFLPLGGKMESQKQILAAAHKTGVQVVMMTTSNSPKDESWTGLHEGVLFLNGIESAEGISWFAENGSDGKPLSSGGLRFLHQPLDRSTESIDAVALLSGGPDPKFETELLAIFRTNAALQKSLVSDYRAFPNEFFGNPAYPDKIFAKWDHDIQERPLTGIGANEWVHKPFLQEAGNDPYEISFQNLVTHILAEDLTEHFIREALTNGHAYLAHDWLCDSAGFTFGAVNNLGVFGMGDSAPIIGNTRVTAQAPVQARFRLFHKGAIIQETTGTNLTFQAKEPGPYRVEAWLNVAGEDRPWVYSNPIYLRTPGPSDVRPPSPTISEEVQATRNIVYREGPEEDSAKHKLDVYGPKGKTNAPVLLFIHGGSWKSGDRSLYGSLGNRYARAGIVTVVPSYRLAPKHPHPAQIEDVAAAFAWTAAHVSEYGGDTNRIYVAGHSAGGHLAALLSLDDHYLSAYQLSPKLIRGVLALSGVYNFTIGESQETVFGRDPKIRRDASPLFHVKTGAPPFLVTFCQWDYFSLPAQARQFHAALLKAGVKSELVFIPRQSHISEIVNVGKEDDPTVSAALRFMK